MSDDQLRERFQSLAPIAFPGTPDRSAIVHDRLRRRQRYTVAVTAGVAAVLASGAIVVASTSQHSSSHPITTLTTVTGDGLSLQSTVKRQFADSKVLSLDEVLSGVSATSGRYGWIIRWGDGGYDRAYGSAGCPAVAPHPIVEEHVFDHRYASHGSYTVVVQVTLCGAQQLQWTGTVKVR